MSGSSPITDERLKRIAWAQYNAAYESPRVVKYTELMEIVAHRDEDVLEYVAAAVSLGSKDKQNGDAKRNQTQLFHELGDPKMDAVV